MRDGAVRAQAVDQQLTIDQQRAFARYAFGIGAPRAAHVAALEMVNKAIPRPVLGIVETLLE